MSNGLEVDPGELRGLSINSGVVAGNLDVLLRLLRTAEGEGAAPGGGFEAVARLREVRASWEERLGTVRDEASGMEHGLVTTAGNFEATEAGIQAGFAALGARLEQEAGPS
ncbi:hypothetical protein H7827_22160 [Streptomyces sp. JH002]|uniref:hypothetical protein n=1 Tax=Streptomyces sp. JH002 TaxID=2763259 RepID=UPI003D806C95